MGRARRDAARCILYVCARGTCYLCGNFIPMGQATIDHVMPKAKGGSDDIWNMQIAHRNCNNKKGNMFLHQARQKIEYFV